MLLVDTTQIKEESTGSRLVKTIFSTEVNNINDVKFSAVSLGPNSKTDYHDHDRPELIYVISGKGILKYNDKEYIIKSDFAIWIEKAEFHQVINTEFDYLKVLTLFIPRY